MLFDLRKNSNEIIKKINSKQYNSYKKDLADFIDQSKKNIDDLDDLYL